MLIIKLSIIHDTIKNNNSSEIFIKPMFSKKLIIFMLVYIYVLS